MKSISNEKVENIREEILDTITATNLTHEQKLTILANKADSFLDVLDVPQGLDELLNTSDDKKCICDLYEGHAPVRPRYIVPDYKKLLDEGCKFLNLDPAKDLMEAINNLLIMYRHVPSVTNYPVYVGAFDELLEPYIDTVDEDTAYKLIKLFLINIDRTVLDSFAHANLGPKRSKVAEMIFEIESELDLTIPNITLKYEEGITSDDFALKAINCTLKCAKPSFANHKMFKSELSEKYVIASCYNGLAYGGGAYTLCRLILGNIAKRASNIEEFKNKELPYVLDIMARYMDARIKFEVEESNFFKSNFLAKEGFIHRDRFTGMFGLVGLAECVNILLEKEGINERFGSSKKATKLGIEIMDIINEFNNNHYNEYCEFSGGHFLLHAQVGISQDIGITPGTRIPIGEEPNELIDHLNEINNFHKYFVSGTGDIFPLDITVHKNPQYTLDIVKGSFKKDIRYLSFYGSDSDVIRITGYLVKKSEIEKLERGEAVLLNTTGLGLGAKNNGKILERKVR